MQDISFYEWTMFNFLVLAVLLRPRKEEGYSYIMEETESKPSLLTWGSSLTYEVLDISRDYFKKVHNFL